MSGPTMSARLGLPLLAAGQAQKDVTHNEALTLVDAAIAPVVVAVGTIAVPVAAVAGDCWIVGTGAGGAWTGQAGALAVQTGGGWRFVDLPQGAMVTERASGARWLRTASGWQAPATIAGPSGGAVVDAEARAALTELLNALSARGFITVAP